MYYINAFESAASAMETGAVSAENMARLILSRLSTDLYSSFSGVKNSAFGRSEDYLHTDL